MSNLYDLYIKYRESILNVKHKLFEELTEEEKTSWLLHEESISNAIKIVKKHILEKNCVSKNDVCSINHNPYDIVYQMCMTKVIKMNEDEPVYHGICSDTFLWHMIYTDFFNGFKKNDTIKNIECPMFYT